MDYINKSIGDNFEKELWEFLGDYKNKKVSAMEVFYECQDDQFLEDIKIEIRDPWVVISFDKKDTILATYVLCYKAIWNLCGPSFYRFYLNDKEFSHKELDFPESFENEKLISRFIKSNKNNLKEKNTYKIEIIDNINLNYLRHIKILLRDDSFIPSLDDYFVKK